MSILPTNFEENGPFMQVYLKGHARGNLFIIIRQAPALGAQALGDLPAPMGQTDVCLATKP